MNLFVVIVGEIDIGFVICFDVIFDDVICVVVE